jgi:hypothetical protein
MVALTSAWGRRCPLAVDGPFAFAPGRTDQFFFLLEESHGGHVGQNG